MKNRVLNVLSWIFVVASIIGFILISRISIQSEIIYGQF